MNNVEEFPVQVHDRMTILQALEVVKRHQPTDVLTIGYDGDGDFFVASSHMSHTEALWLLERGKQWVFDSVKNKSSRVD